MITSMSLCPAQTVLIAPLPYAWTELQAVTVCYDVVIRMPQPYPVPSKETYRWPGVRA